LFLAGANPECKAVHLGAKVFTNADTLASMDRVEKIVKNTKARFIVQHDGKDVASLPKFPAYLE
jgi:hypothetical protein